MKTFSAIMILLLMTLSLQPVQAQSSGKSYQEWLEENTGRKTAAKPAPASRAKAAAPAAKAEEAPAAAPMAAPVGTFTGTIACTDCQGIKTELTLTGDPGGGNRSFTMKQTYVGRPADKSVVNSNGKWFLAKGNKQDPDAVVLQLIPTAGNIEPLYFLQVSATEVKLLDRQQNEIKSTHNYTLRKQ